MFVYVIIFWPFSFPSIVDFPDEGEKEVKEVEIQWRRAKAGTKLPEDCMIRYDNDPDIRLGRCMINDGYYKEYHEVTIHRGGRNHLFKLAVRHNPFFIQT